MFCRRALLDRCIRQLQRNCRHRETSLPEPGMVGWVLLTLLAAVSFALFNIFIDLYAPPQEGGLQLGTGILLAAGLMMLPITAIAGGFHFFPGASVEGDFAVLYATLINAARWWLMFIIIRMSGAIFVSQIAYVIVLAGFGWQALFFGGTVSGFIWAAAGLLSCWDSPPTRSPRCASNARRGRATETRYKSCARSRARCAGRRRIRSV